MLVSDTPDPKKKRKRTSNTPNTLPTKKKRKTHKSCSVPELILCADELKSEIKHEDKLLDLDVKLKQDESLEYTVPEVILSTNILLKAEHPEPKTEILSPVRVKKKTKSLVSPDKLTITSVEKAKPKKKKKSKVKENQETVIKQNIKSDSDFMSLSSQFLNTSETLNLSGLGNQSDYLSTMFHDTKILHSGILVKEEPVTPEKPQHKIEPVEIGTLFHSNIKQELECDDAVDVLVSLKLSFQLTDSCIERYQTTLHCAIPPAYINNIQNGINTQLKTQHLKYVESLQGVLLRYTNISYAERTAKLVSISPELHFNINCTVTVFKPKLGVQLEGKVIKMGPGYVNCLVFGYFTAVVYDRFKDPVSVGNVIRFKLQFYQVTVHNDFILKGSPL